MSTLPPNEEREAARLKKEADRRRYQEEAAKQKSQALVDVLTALSRVPALDPESEDTRLDEQARVLRAAACFLGLKPQSIAGADGGDV